MSFEKARASIFVGIESLTPIRLSNVPAETLAPSTMSNSVSDLLDILVTTSTQRNHQVLLGLHRLSQVEGGPESVRSFQSWDNAFQLGTQFESSQGFLVGSDLVFGTAGVFEIGVLRSYTG